jgi:hypothetical protein
VSKSKSPNVGVCCSGAPVLGLHHPDSRPQIVAAQVEIEKFESGSSCLALKMLKLSEVDPGSNWGQPGVSLGSTWGQAEVKLGSPWGPSGVTLGSTLGSPWGQPWVALGSSCTALPFTAEAHPAALHDPRVMPPLRQVARQRVPGRRVEGVRVGRAPQYLGPGRHCSPHPKLPFNSRHEGSRGV